MTQENQNFSIEFEYWQVIIANDIFHLFYNTESVILFHNYHHKLSDTSQIIINVENDYLKLMINCTVIYFTLWCLLFNIDYFNDKLSRTCDCVTKFTTGAGDLNLCLLPGLISGRLCSRERHMYVPHLIVAGLGAGFEEQCDNETRSDSLDRQLHGSLSPRQCPAATERKGREGLGAWVFR